MQIRYLLTSFTHDNYIYKTMNISGCSWQNLCTSIAKLCTSIVMKKVHTTVHTSCCHGDRSNANVFYLKNKKPIFLSN